MRKKVAILGGGVGGMSAAHELIERGFDVDVYEAKQAPGGKARSIAVPGTGTDGRQDLPGEHGFRFFPGFYKHLPDTMKRIPYPGNAKGVYDNLVQASEYLLADSPEKNLTFLVRFPESILEWRELFKSFFHGMELDIPDGELAHFVERLMVILTSCDERRLEEYEKISWWSFIGAQERSAIYQHYLAQGLTRSLVAMRAQVGSARTVGNILVQLLLDVYAPGIDFDRVLNGPTNEAWLNPWLEYLTSRGVRFHFDSPVAEFHCEHHAITGVTVRHADGSGLRIEADYYISAIPVEAFHPLVNPAMKEFAPELRQLGKLRVAWMNGIQFFLREDFPLVHGHVNHIMQPWALTSISQAQFWPDKLCLYGDGMVKGCLSIDISDWETPGILFHKPAKELTTREDVMREVQAQVQRSLPPDQARMLDDSNIHTWFLDPNIKLPNPTGTTNLEPLLINTAGSWQYRPEASTSIRNLFLAADFVRTYTDLATMEAANEAARRAVNAILALSGSCAEPCHIWPLEEPAIFAPFREYDRIRFRLGLDHSSGPLPLPTNLPRQGPPGDGGEPPPAPLPLPPTQTIEEVEKLEPPIQQGPIQQGPTQQNPVEQQSP
jgi:uncharacterized protein with NAD-binding domain and iron-sulfur cluster